MPWRCVSFSSEAKAFAKSRLVIAAVCVDDLRHFSGCFGFFDRFVGISNGAPPRTSNNFSPGFSTRASPFCIFLVRCVFESRSIIFVHGTRFVGSWIRHFFVLGNASRLLCPRGIARPSAQPGCCRGLRILVGAGYRAAVFRGDACLPIPSNFAVLCRKRIR